MVFISVCIGVQIQQGAPAPIFILWYEVIELFNEMDLGHP